MKFTEALAAVFNEGKRIRRSFWQLQVSIGVEQYQLCIKGFSSSGPDDGKWHSFIITESDYFAEDWEVVE